MKVKLTKRVEQHIRANARRGARALDKVYPEWFRQDNLKLTKLDQKSYEHCVWGQLDNGLAGADEAFQSAFSCLIRNEQIPGYFPAARTGRHDSCYASPKAQANHVLAFKLGWRGGQRLRRATQNAEWLVLDDEWRTQVHLRRRAAGLRAAA